MEFILSSSSPLIFFFSQSNTTNHLSLPYYSSHTPLSATKLARMGSYFSLTQWQELQLQALIYRHIMAGDAVPEELLHLVRRSVAVADTPVYRLRQYYPPNQAALGYRGRGTVDPQPGRCRRTDGKKWRCSRDVVAGQKYCERHFHRGRNRSRKPVETAAEPYGGEAQKGGSGDFTLTAASNTSRLADLFHLNQRHCDSIIDTKIRLESQYDGDSTDRTLRHFFDDWSNPLHKADCDTNYSATNLSVSMPENSPSNFLLTLATGELSSGFDGWAPRGGTEIGGSQL